MDLYPQPRGSESSVEDILSSPMQPGLPPGRDVPRPGEAPAPGRGYSGAATPRLP
jgi:hypothetical protein